MADAILNVLRAQHGTVIPQDALERFRHDRVIEQYVAVMGIYPFLDGRLVSRQPGG
jgi:hypothetical protein